VQAFGKTRLGIFIGVTAILIAGLFLLPPIPQAPAYHAFADRRSFFGLPNFLNAVSNFFFLIVGIAGLRFVLRRNGAGLPAAFIDRAERWPYAVFFAGVALVAFGSGYYHLAPGNERLFWDRLPMTLAFMSFLAAMVAERIHVGTGVRLLFPLICLGAGSLLYWLLTERQGYGDLRPYVFVQFYPLTAVPLLVLLFEARYTRGGDIILVLLAYGASKMVELLDVPLFVAGRIVSGHTLKHLLAALAVYGVLRMLRKRRPLVEPGSPPVGTLHRS
jgi:hypothetical protein